MIIDIHAHYVSPRLIDEARRAGGRYGVQIESASNGQQTLVFPHTGERLRPFFRELCDLPVRAAYLDSLGVGMQMVSTWTDMTGDDLEPAQAIAWARLQNETLAADARDSAGRFLAMGVLPMQDAAIACRELDHIVKNLGIRSIEICTSINGRELDHADFRPLWKRIADLGVLALLHPPFKPAAVERTGDYFLNNLLSYPMDTTIAAARLIFSGILREMPELKICLAHGGGFLPYQIGRLERGFAAHPACRKSLSESPINYLRAFYYDTLTHHDDALAFLHDMVGSERLLYGSDYPFEMLDEAGPKRIRNLALPVADEAAILGDNVRELLSCAAPAVKPPAARREVDLSRRKSGR